MHFTDCWNGLYRLNLTLGNESTASVVYSVE